MTDQDIRKRNFILATTLLGAFWSAYNTTAVNVAVPAITQEFGASTTYTSWIITSTLLVTSLFVLPIGKLSDLYGRKKTLLIGSVIMTATSLLCGISQSVTMMIIFRGIQGIGGAMMAATVVSIVSGAFPHGSRGKALGINVASTYIGLSAGPFISGMIVKYFSWRGIFFLSIPLGLLLIFMILKIDAEWKSNEKIKIDYFGAILYGIGILGLIWGLTNFNSMSVGKIAFGSGLVIMIAFGFYEVRTDDPLLDIRALKVNRVLVFSTLASFINYSSTYAISYMMSLYLQYVKGLDPQYAGMVLLIQPAFQAVFSPLAGILSDRVDPQYVASVGMSIIAVSLFLLSTLDLATNLIFIVILLSLIGLGFALFSSPNTNSIMSSMNKNQYGVASGILSTARTVGQSFSMAVTALIVSVYLADNSITASTTPDFVQSFRLTFIIFAVFCVVGIFASLARGKRDIV
ncbi:MFS transporter [Alkalibacter mobilis]|uniref:MFS transporter n=1 Tax=Alkalibacter mobilis TaxID=2787712 RepID=UPI00189DDE74|nr:MFS transporter [Alkalibacter mobilis]MBF7097517.1 MFS transporter [Alkalibacter mobilis]